MSKRVFYADYTKNSCLIAPCTHTSSKGIIIFSEISAVLYRFVHRYRIYSCVGRIGFIVLLFVGRCREFGDDIFHEIDRNSGYLYRLARRCHNAACTYIPISNANNNISVTSNRSIT